MLLEIDGRKIRLIWPSASIEQLAATYNLSQFLAMALRAILGGGLPPRDKSGTAPDHLCHSPGLVRNRFISDHQGVCVFLTLCGLYFCHKWLKKSEGSAEG